LKYSWSAVAAVEAVVVSTMALRGAEALVHTER
jgi:hypothetical protein